MDEWLLRKPTEFEQHDILELLRRRRRAHRRKQYLKQQHKIFYCNLLNSGKLNSHLVDAEEEA